MGLGWEVGQLDVDTRDLEAEVRGKMYIELPEACRETTNQVDLFNKAMDGLVHVDLLWWKKFGRNSEQRVRTSPGRLMRVLSGTPQDVGRHYSGIR